MKNFWIVLILLLPARGSSQPVATWYAGFQLPVAIGAYQEAGDPDIGGGGRFAFLVRPTSTFPFQIGLDIGLAGRGKAMETIPLSVAGFVDNYKVRASNNLFSMGLLLRFEPFAGKRLSPYLEGSAGGNDFYSQVRFYQKNGGGNAQTAGRKSDYAKDRWAFFYGGSAGLKLALGKKRQGGLELRCAYLRGGKTAYNNQPRFDDAGILAAERVSSATDMLVPQIGGWINLREKKRP